MDTNVRKSAPLKFARRLLGSACIAALSATVAMGTGADSATRTAGEPWLGSISVATIAVATNAKSKRATQPSGEVDVEVAERLNWWSVGGPAYRWNEIILDAMQDAFVVLPMAARHLALFHAALDDAVVNARQHNSSTGASEYAAVAETAAVILADLFPSQADHFAKKAEEAILVRSLAGADTAEAIATGKAYGQKVAAIAISRAKTDGSDAKWAGTVPEGPGRWKGTNPIAPLAGGWRPWVLSSPSEFRPHAPPAFDSGEVKAALAELKSFARSPKSNHRAIFWEVHGGARAHTLWNEIARTKLLEYSKGTADGARILAALNIALADAGTACWDAKYAYWFIRPSQLDADVKPLFPPPNHPSFPAAHGCFSTAAATVLADAFPKDRERLLALGREAAEARVWAGIHYRFDIDAGQEIGRRVGAKVLDKAFAR